MFFQKTIYKVKIINLKKFRLYKVSWKVANCVQKSFYSKILKWQKVSHQDKKNWKNAPRPLTRQSVHYIFKNMDRIEKMMKNYSIKNHSFSGNIFYQNRKVSGRLVKLYQIEIFVRTFEKLSGRLLSGRLSMWCSDQITSKFF